MVKNVLSVLLVICGLAVYGQVNTDKCGESYTIESFEQVNGKGSYSQSREKFWELQHDMISNNYGAPENVVYQVPVVVHVIYDSEEDNISREQIVNALETVNRDYRRRNADTVNTRSIFKGVAADLEIELVLAKLDPQGNCTDGVTRTQSSQTVDAFNNVKSLIRWPNNKYLNIWVVRSIDVGGSNTTLGYAYKPVFGGNSWSQDGIVIRHDQMGEIGTAASNMGGRTLQHEAGHYFGLDHPFEGGCFGGDGVADTPPVANPSYGCDLNKNSCTNELPDLPDQIENYMDYADGACMNMFTQGQKTIMRNSLGNINLRGYLVTNNNKNLTGITPNQVLPCTPKSDFRTENSLVCEGQSIQFEDRSYLGNITQYNWSFPGGTPATSNDANPIVTYNQKGIYNVTLEAVNASGSNTLTKSQYISVRSQTNTPYVNGFMDDFEAYPIPNENWHVVKGLDTIDFRYFTKTAYNGQSCVSLQNFYALNLTNPPLTEITDEIISHTILLDKSSTATLSFAYAFVEKTFGNTDKLKIYVSDDCGNNWDLVSQRIGPLLKTLNSRIDTSWYPTQSNHWKIGTVDLANYTLSPNAIMIKFEFTSGGGNNFFLDEVAIATTIGTEELFVNETEIVVYPNPANNFINIKGLKATGTISIADLAGRIVTSMRVNNINGDEIELPIGEVTPGIYLVNITQNEQIITRKIIIQ